MLRRTLPPMSLRRDVAAASGAAALVASTLNVQRRHSWSPYVYYKRGQAKWEVPGPGQCHETKANLENLRYNTKTRSQWDYNRIDERITAESEFTKMDDRPDFGGPREESAQSMYSYMYTNPPKTKKLWEHFDEYTKPGSNAKLEAARAVGEHWDSKGSYYPGEAWQRNRPSFRSVPKELLNKQTFYHWSDWVLRNEEMQGASRPRMWNPIWPPPGYKVPKMVCKREFVFGVEEPGIVHEIERWYWHRNWFENNCRQGPVEIILYVALAYFLYYAARRNMWYFNMRTMMSNMWYPGRHGLRNFGEPADPNTECWWWQEPLENRKEFPEAGLTWYTNEIRFGYINWRKREEERQRMEAATA